MQNLPRFLTGQFGSVASLIALLVATAAGAGQTPGPAVAETGKATPPLNWTAQQDHQNMMEQLGITRLRPGPSGQPGATNSANDDPAKANPFPDLPDLLTLKNGQKVTNAGIWWKQRRPEIVEDLDPATDGRPKCQAVIKVRSAASSDGFPAPSLRVPALGHASGGNGRFAPAFP
jgi:hypothetical protein